MKPSAQRCVDLLKRSGCWIPLYVLQSPEIGGTEAGRRLREAKAEGEPVEWEYSKRRGRRCTYYRIRTEPVQLEMAI